jgi:hypothetical protein
MQKLSSEVLFVWKQTDSVMPALQHKFPNKEGPTQDTPRLQVNWD